MEFSTIVPKMFLGGIIPKKALTQEKWHMVHMLVAQSQIVLLSNHLIPIISTIYGDKWNFHKKKRERKSSGQNTKNGLIWRKWHLDHISGTQCQILITIIELDWGFQNSTKNVSRGQIPKKGIETNLTYYCVTAS
jgi:hypothetical protein